ncbi:unnamed protein product [Clonostachys rosea f. rosea IK726]|uniref:Uncharacterized protein n=2 Tax=Bionectria ochroleuca TaxID=29856 RepID=A0A8H7N9J5_BIOOC|nr:unnamed protein product [Clonostachys rosea f. rosea IK726]
MCHRIIAERVCEDCGSKMGETVIGFEACSRRCPTPSYRLSAEPFEQVCAECATYWRHRDSDAALTSGSEADHSIFPKPFAKEGGTQRRRKSSTNWIEAAEG